MSRRTLGAPPSVTPSSPLTWVRKAERRLAKDLGAAPVQEGLHQVVQHRHALAREPHVCCARVEGVAVDDRVDEAVLELADRAEVRRPHEAHLVRVRVRARGRVRVR
eukprot:scaffold89313_cov48-Phaeocystis_antarctica.AAC.1